MPPHTIPLLSPAELAFLYTSLASSPGNPIRTDGRGATQFRPLSAETGILPGANGSARIGFADGTQAIVGVKAEVEKTVKEGVIDWGTEEEEREEKERKENEEDGGRRRKRRRFGQGSWVEMSIEIPGVRDDDNLPVFLAEMMRETIVHAENGSATVPGSTAASGYSTPATTSTLGHYEVPTSLKERLVINAGWHWRLYIDVLLLSPPLSYPLPLLSLTTHLALLSAKLPRLKSKDEEDPMFDDDWDAAEWLYSRPPKTSSNSLAPRKPAHSTFFRPPVTLLVISVGENVIFDPTQDEISVADAVFAVSIVADPAAAAVAANDGETEASPLKLISIRTIDPPARMTNHGILNSENPAFPDHGATGGAGAGGSPQGRGVPGSSQASNGKGEKTTAVVDGVWKPRTGGVKRSVISRVVKMVLKKGGVGEEVLMGLEGVEVE